MSNLGIDRGFNNWLACIINVGKSSIAHDLHFKFLNHFYNKQIANIKANNVQRSLDEKTEGRKEFGKRIKRDLYPTANGTKINGEVNEASNICKKGATTLGLFLKAVSSGVLIAPLKVRIRDVQKSPAF